MTPRSTIHYYIREGLLPAPDRPSANSAVYSEAHLLLLRDLDRLRRPPIGPVALPLMKRVAARMRSGIELEVALSLERTVAGAFDPTKTEQRLSKLQLCNAANLTPEFLEELLQAGLLVSDATDAKFDALDVEMAVLYRDVIQATGISPKAGKPIADGIRKLSAYEMSLREGAIEGMPAEDAAQVTLQMERAIHAIRTYLFYRARLADLRQEQGLTNEPQ